MTMPAVILLVEDDEDVADSYRRTFHRDGLALDIAETWGEALALFRVVGHRLVIADYNLPGDEHDDTGGRVPGSGGIGWVSPRWGGMLCGDHLLGALGRWMCGCGAQFPA